jgi:hypothetical protein
MRRSGGLGAVAERGAVEADGVAAMPHAIEESANHLFVAEEGLAAVPVELVA